MKRRKKRNGRQVLRCKFTLKEWINVPKNIFIENLFTYQFGDNEDYDRWLDYGSRSDRLWLVSERYGLDELARDPDWQVRKAVAEQGYAQETLSKDPVGEVREAVARIQERMRERLNSTNFKTRLDAYMTYNWKGKERLYGVLDTYSIWWEDGMMESE